jgi:hypothetical protein
MPVAIERDKRLQRRGSSAIRKYAYCESIVRRLIYEANITLFFQACPNNTKPVVFHTACSTTILIRLGIGKDGCSSKSHDMPFMEVTLGNCKYCGKPVGFLRRQHTECKEKHRQREQVIENGRLKIAPEVR